MWSTYGIHSLGNVEVNKCSSSLTFAAWASQGFHHDKDIHEGFSYWSFYAFVALEGQTLWQRSLLIIDVQFGTCVLQGFALVRPEYSWAEIPKIYGTSGQLLDMVCEIWQGRWQISTRGPFNPFKALQYLQAITTIIATSSRRAPRRRSWSSMRGTKPQHPSSSGTQATTRIWFGGHPSRFCATQDTTTTRHARRQPGKHPLDRHRSQPAGRPPSHAAQQSGPTSL